MRSPVFARRGYNCNRRFRLRQGRWNARYANRRSNPTIRNAVFGSGAKARLLAWNSRPRSQYVDIEISFVLSPSDLRFFFFPRVYSTALANRWSARQTHELPRSVYKRRCYRLSTSKCVISTQNAMGLGWRRAYWGGSKRAKDGPVPWARGGRLWLAFKRGQSGLRG